jgi:hypothetical protein
MHVYVNKDDQQFGPYTVEQLRMYVQQGNFTTADLACCDGQNWVKVAEVPGFATGDDTMKASQQVQTVEKHAVEQQRVLSDTSTHLPKKIKILLWGGVCGGALSLLLGASLLVRMLDGEENIPEARIAHGIDLVKVNWRGEEGGELEYTSSVIPDDLKELAKVIAKPDPFDDPKILEAILAKAIMSERLGASTSPLTVMNGVRVLDEYHRKENFNPEVPFTGWTGSLDKNRMPYILERYGKGGKIGSHLDGPMRKWYKGVKVSIGNFKDGMRHGLFIDYQDSGYVSSGGYFLNDRKEGLWAQWSAEDIREIKRYKSGVLHGVSISYDLRTENIDIYQNGRKISERRGSTVRYRVREWHLSGFLKSKGECLEGKRIGEWIFYRNDGSIDKRINYDEKPSP